MNPLKNLQCRIQRMRGGCLVFAVGAAALLTACAPIPAGPEEFSAGRARVVLPSTQWEDLGKVDEALPMQPAPGVFPLQTRALALRGTRHEILAVMLVRTNSTNYPREHTLWSGSCPTQKGLTVEDATSGSPVRIDCMRFKRWANNEGWLEKNHPDVVRWMADHKAEPAQPYSHLNYRYGTEGGAYLEVNAMVDQRLLRPKTSNNEEFLRAGRPALAWSKQVVDAARISAGMMDGFFAVPPFPFAPPP